MKKASIISILFFLVSLPLFGQDSNMVQTPYHILKDSDIDSQVSKFKTRYTHGLNVMYIHISGFTKHYFYYTLTEVDSGVFYCKNDLGYTHLFRLNGEKALINELPIGQNYYMYRKQTGTDVFDEIVVIFDNKSVTLNSLDGEVLGLLASGNSNFYLNKKIFQDIQNNLTTKVNK